MVTAVTVGCYSTTPIVTASLPLGRTVQLRVTDAGRAALSETMGPSVDVVEGRLVAHDSVQWTLAVTSVKLLRGGEQVWSGERVRIPARDVALASEKTFSRTRTAIVAGATIGVVVMVAKSGLAGLLQGDEGKLPSDSGASTRIPRP